METQEEQPTQPATQIYNDDRRSEEGHYELNDEEGGDIICVLQPISAAALVAANEILAINPRNVHITKNELNMRERNTQPVDIESTFRIRAQGQTLCGIALRLSTELKEPLGGFHFGRNPARCDFVIGRNEPSRRISNIHFRIYINEHGSLMIEDQSTNGTVVDGNVLRGKDKENGLGHKHTVENGQKIVLVMVPAEENFEFVVWLPKRSEFQQDLYEENFNEYIAHMKTLRERRTAALAGHNGNTPDLFAPTRASTSTKTLITKRIKEWQGGTKYNKVGTIGKGAFAVVYKVTTKSEGVPYAAKELEKRRFMKNGIVDAKMEQEMNIMSRIKHPNIVQYVEHVEWENYLYIIMEYVPGGDLGSLISQSGYLPEGTVRDIADQLLSALDYLHAMNITHRDIKPDNILISQRDPFTIKLTDFGLSKMVDNEETFLRTFCGTLLYCAPEVYMEYRDYDHAGQRVARGANKKCLPKQRYGHAVDVWSLAGVLWFCMTGQPPYPVAKNQETTYQQLLDRVMTEALDIRPLQNVGISDNGLRFIKAMLHNRPEYRATVEDLRDNCWITGRDDVEVQVTQETEIEESSSQLSQLDIQDKEADGQVEDSIEFDNTSMSDVTEIQIAIPSSFDTSDGMQDENDSYGFRQSGQNGRLFGEVNMSDVGSSGAVPLHHLNLPDPNASRVNLDVSGYSQHPDFDASSQALEKEFKNIISQVPTPLPNPEIMSPPPPPLARPQITPQIHARNQNQQQRAERSSSLMGTESMVGNLNMHSPASMASSSPLAETPPAEFARGPTISLRRPRDPDSDEDEDGWKPKGMPPKRRVRSGREIEFEVPPSTFWDPADKSTHHENYPRMTTAEYERFSQFAATRGEKFRPGQKTFDDAMRSFRSSRSRSTSIEPTRAQSEPTAEEGRRMLIKRDERRLEDDANGRPFTAHAHIQDEFLPYTATASSAVTPAAVDSTEIFQVISNDFATPMRILGKLVSTPQSVLPTISLNITECITTWGRMKEALMRYPNTKETRVPKFAFKIMAFKPNFYVRFRNKVHVGTDQNQDMAFYISTKANAGIWINDVHLPSYNPAITDSASQFWGELRHGDFITVWKGVGGSTVFRFECHWGKSKELRNDGEPFTLISDLMFLSDIEAACLRQEKALWDEQQVRAEEERKLMEELKQAERASQLQPRQNDN